MLNEPLRCSPQGMSTLGEDEHLRTPDPLQKRPPEDDLDIPEFLRRAPKQAIPGGDPRPASLRKPGDGLDDLDPE